MSEENTEISNLSILTGFSFEHCERAFRENQNNFEKTLSALSPPAPPPPPQRWEGEFTSSDDLAVLEEFCRSENTSWKDPSFPPNNSSLFLNGNSECWFCPKCHFKDNPLPPANVLRAAAGPSSDDLRDFLKFLEIANPLLLMQLRGGRGATGLMVQVWQKQILGDWTGGVACGGCGEEFPIHVLNTRVDSWRRFPEDEAANCVLFRGVPRADDVRQGSVGNCWFLAALSIIASAASKQGTQDDTLQRTPPYSLFNPPRFSPWGVYCVNLHICGNWRSFLVDDYFPTTPVGKVAYAKGARKQLWVGLLEKAAAKAAGCYEALHGGTFREAFGMLTGCPTETILLDIKDRDFLWSRVLSIHESGFLLGACCIGRESLSVTALKSRGLQAPHGYAVLDLKEFEESGVRLIKLRNPWGEESVASWRGRWSADSEDWKSSAGMRYAVEVGLKSKEGIYLHNTISEFWMEWGDFCENFTTLEICRLRSSWSTIRQQGWLPASTGLGNYFHIKIAQDAQTFTRADIAVYQEQASKRGDTLLSDLGFLLLEISSDCTVKVTAFQQRELTGESSTEVNLKKGFEYFLIPLSLSHVRSAFAHKRVNVVVSHDSIDRSICCDAMPLDESLLSFALIAYSEQFEESVRDVFVLRPVEGLQIREIREKGVGILLIASFGDSSNRSFPNILIACDCEGSLGMSSSRGSFLTQDVLKWGEQRVIQVLTISDLQKDLCYLRNISFAFVSTSQGLFPPPPIDWPNIHRCAGLTENLSIRFYLGQGVAPSEALLLALQDIS